MLEELQDGLLPSRQSHPKSQVLSAFVSTPLLLFGSFLDPYSPLVFCFLPLLLLSICFRPSFSMLHSRSRRSRASELVNSSC